jgi:hypothetical protein
MMKGFEGVKARTLRWTLVFASSAALAPSVSASAESAPSNSVMSSSESVERRDGARLKKAEEALKEVFPGTTSVKEQPFLPLESGGSSFMGLVARLLGDRPDREFEGIGTRRTLYHAFDNDRKIGIAHGSTVSIEGAPVDVFIFYSPEGVIRDLRIEGLPESTLASLRDGKHLEQFRGRSPEDFEVVLGRKGRIQSRGAFHSEARRPSSGSARAAFDRILRAVRFNAAFMDVAYFITQHPDLADEAKISPITVVSGPEAFIKSRPTPTPLAPFEKPLIQGLEEPKPE